MPTRNPYAEDPALRAAFEWYARRKLGRDPLACRYAEAWPDIAGKAVVIDESDPLYGWRMWRPVLRYGWMAVLCAPYRPDPDDSAARWDPGRNRASSRVCGNRVQTHPSPGCYCGFRAMQSLVALTRFHADQKSRVGDWPDLAVARVALWGRVASGAAGDDWPHTIRAERARIVGSLYLGDSIPDRTKRDLSRRHGVAVEPLSPLLKKARKVHKGLRSEDEWS